MTILLAAGCGKGTHGFARAGGHSSSVAAKVLAFQRLSADGEATLRALVDSGNLPDLRWPNFADYRVQVKDFYEPAAYALAWSRERQATRQARAVIELLQNADNKGLGAEDYDGPHWPERLARLRPANPQPSEADLLRFDLALTVSLMRYISDLQIGKVNPRDFEFGFNIEQEKYDLPEFLRRHLVEAQDVKAVLEQVEPPFAGYHRTIKALQTYLQLARQDDGQPLPVTKKRVEPGDSYPGVARLARLLRLLGDLPPEAVAPAVYHGVLVEAVKHFQRRHGLEPDGRLGQSTLEQLNTPLSQRIRQLRLTLERWRWVPHEFPEPPIVVNIPEFRLRTYNKQYRVAFSMNVVVGRALRSQTPVFANQMKFVIFRPYWNVPPSIQRRELVPKIEEDRAYLEKQGYEVVTSQGEVVSAGAVSDEVLEQLRSGKLAIRQKPGRNNALGPAKFVFPNEYNVYLHGAPEQELFSQARRDFSHGCIRVQYPLALAAWVLRDRPEWTTDRIRAAVNGEKPVQVNLERPIPVLIVYATAIVDENGEVDFFQDIYGQDAALEGVLAKGYPYRW